MKLRDRRKSALSNIKQEDRKLNLTNAQSYSEKSKNSTDILDLTIKQEDTKEDKSLLQQDDDLDNEKYRYQCDFCKMKMTDLKSVLEHRTSIHGIKQFTKRRIKNIDVVPVEHDPDFYCKSCEKYYNNTNAFRYHLQHVHHMILKPMQRGKPPKNDIDPDPNDPSFYCRACDLTYKHKDAYKRHCRFAHGLNLAKFADRKATSSSLTDSYCHVCDKRLSSIGAYRSHLFAIHKIDSRPIQQERNAIMPNVKDPNFYCRSCEKKLASRASFKLHLKHVHSIFGSVPKKSKFEPNIDDPNNYCIACQKTYISKGDYRKHLRLVHQMTLTPLRGSANRKHLPDPYNPDYHCSVCKKTYASARNYRLHCKNTHLMQLNRASIINPSAEINVNDPKLYCAQCDHYYSSKQSFSNHLRAIHDVYPTI